jgi:hypothetical protein
MNDDLLLWFLLSDKPEWASPLDLLIMANLIARGDTSGRSSPKNAELARACNLAQNISVRTSIKRLVEHGWITIEFHAGIGLPNTYVVQRDALPRFNHQALTPEK